MKNSTIQSILKRYAAESATGVELAGTILKMGRFVYGDPRFKKYVKTRTGKGLSSIPADMKVTLLREFLASALSEGQTE